MSYEWLKVIHILAIVSWMAGLFYLPRLFVYHVDAVVGSDKSETFKVMERRLLSAIMRPACVVSLVSGFGLITIVGVAGQSWLWIKLAAVVLMLLYHGSLERHRAQFGRDERPGSGRYFRILNEVPTVLLIVIVIAVVVRPFS